MSLVKLRTRHSSKLPPDFFTNAATLPPSMYSRKRFEEQSLPKQEMMRGDLRLRRMESSSLMARISGEEEERCNGDGDGDEESEGSSSRLLMDLTAKKCPLSRLTERETRPKEPYPRGERRIHRLIFMGEDAMVFFAVEASMAS